MGSGRDTLFHSFETLDCQQVLGVPSVNCTGGERGEGEKPLRFSTALLRDIQPNEEGVCELAG